jgi:phosphatidylglycerophosphatase C
MTDVAPPVRIAIYDLDRTILRKPTFTLFLLWAAWRVAPWRLLALPALLLLFVGAGLRLYGRDSFKPAAIRLMLGRRISASRAADLAQRFAAWRVPADVPPGGAAAVARDRAEGYRLLLATAAPEFYAVAIGAALGFDDVIATRHVRDANGAWLPTIDGTNCYGPEKARRIEQWLADHAGAEHAVGGQRRLRFYSDHASDAPSFALADERYAVGRGGSLARHARAQGWTLVDFSRAA